MRKIRQKHLSDCGAASSAMLAGVSYKTTFKLLFPSGDSSRGTTIQKIRSVLKSLHIEVTPRVRKLRGTSTLKNNAILIVRAYGGRHAVVWDYLGQRILDPHWSRIPRHPLLKSYKFLSCMEIK